MFWSLGGQGRILDPADPVCFLLPTWNSSQGLSPSLSLYQMSPSHACLSVRPSSKLSPAVYLRAPLHPPACLSASVLLPVCLSGPSPRASVRITRCQVGQHGHWWWGNKMFLSAQSRSNPPPPPLTAEPDYRKSWSTGIRMERQDDAASLCDG